MGTEKTDAGLVVLFRAALLCFEVRVLPVQEIVTELVDSFALEGAFTEWITSVIVEIPFAVSEVYSVVVGTGPGCHD